MDRRRLEAFILLAELGGFRHAASELKTTQPALSQLIARLESEVGMKLIDRSTRPITTTQAGKEFYFRAVKVLDAMSAIDTLVEDSQAARFGRVRVGVVPALLFSSPTKSVRSFKTQHENVEITLQNLRTSDLVEALDRGSVDVGIMFTVPDLKDLSSQPLYSEDYMVCLPEQHPLTAKRVVEFADLEHERLIHGYRSSYPQGHDSIIAACASAGYSPQYFAQLGSFLDHAGMVSAGMGVSFAPTSFQHLRPNGVEYRTLTNPSVGVTVTVNWFEDRLDEAGRAFVRHCIQECLEP